MAEIAVVEAEREIVRELLKNPERPAAAIAADLSARGAAVNEASVEQLRELVAIVVEEQARARADGVLLARPVVGKIDHGALTREIIARFPKILAALAE